jgi:hypothetical protein
MHIKAIRLRVEDSEAGHSLEATSRQNKAWPADATLRSVRGCANRQTATGALAGAGVQSPGRRGESRAGSGPHAAPYSIQRSMFTLTTTA